MKVLIVHRNFCVDGGDSTYTIKLAHLLKARGHDVTVLTMQDHRNDGASIKLVEIPNPYGDRNVTRFSDLTATAKIKYGFNSIYSASAYRAMKDLLQREKFDVIHIQNIHHVLTASVVYALGNAGIPVVWTLHDYKLLCPSSNFFLKGMICEKCKGGRYYHAALNTCKRGSLFASFSVMTSSYLDKIMRLNKRIDMFVTPSNFLREKLIEYGFDAARVMNIPNFIARGELHDGVGGGYILYYGNFSKEKGVDVLLKICAELHEIPFVFAGSGPLESEVAGAAMRLPNVTYRPFLKNDEMKDALRRAKMVIIPSQWYENFPFTALEPMAMGKMVIASRVGGIPEIVADGINGVLVDRPDSTDEWKEKITRIYHDEEKIREFQQKAYESAARFNENEHMSRIEALYRESINNKRLRG